MGVGDITEIMEYVATKKMPEGSEKPSDKINLEDTIDKKSDAPVSEKTWDEFDPLDNVPREKGKKKVLPVWLIYKIKEEGGRPLLGRSLAQLIEVWVDAPEVEEFRKTLRDFLFVFTGKTFQGKSIHEMRIMWDWCKYVWWKWNGFVRESLDKSKISGGGQGRADEEIKVVIADGVMRFCSSSSDEILGEILLDPRLSLVLEKANASSQREWAEKIVRSIWEKVRKAKIKRRSSRWAKILPNMLFSTLSEHEIVLSWVLRCNLERKKELLRKLLSDPGIFYTFALLFDSCLLELYLEEKEEAIELAVFLFEKLVNEIRETYGLKRAHPYDVRECAGGLDKKLEFRAEKSIIRFYNEREEVGGVVFSTWANTELYPRFSLKKIKIERQEKIESAEDLILIATKPTITPQLDRLTFFLSSLVRIYLFTTPVVLTKDVLNYASDERKRELRKYLKAVFALCLLRISCFNPNSELIGYLYNELKPLFKPSKIDDYPFVSPIDQINTLILHELPLRFACFKIYINNEHRLAIVKLKSLVRKLAKCEISEGRTKIQKRYAKAREILEKAIEELYQTFIRRELLNNKEFVPSFFINRLDKRLKREEVVDKFLKWHYDREEKKRRSGEFLRKASRLVSGCFDEDLRKIYEYLDKLKYWRTAYEPVYAKKEDISEDLSYLAWEEEGYLKKRRKVRLSKVEEPTKKLDRILKDFEKFLEEHKVTLKYKLSSEVFKELREIISALSDTTTTRDNLINDTITPRIYAIQDKIDSETKIDPETALKKVEEKFGSPIKEYLAHVLKQEFYEFYQEKGLAPKTCYWALQTKAKQIYGKGLKELALEELVKTVIEACKTMGKRKLANGRFGSSEGKQLIPQASHPASDPTSACDEEKREILFNFYAEKEVMEIL